jgi:hypothetical protein
MTFGDGTLPFEPGSKAVLMRELAKTDHDVIGIAAPEGVAAWSSR